MKKILFGTIIVFIIAWVVHGEINKSNIEQPSTEKESQVLNSEVTNNGQFVNNIGGKVFLNDNTATKVQEIINDLPKNNDSLHLKHSLNAYVINKINAITSPSGLDVKHYYDNVYNAMQCSIFFMQKNNIDGYQTIKKINSTLDSNKEFLMMKESAERRMEGTVFLAIPKNEQPQVCVENY